MAGGSESPRQKMIGMMYLVLTALLALQVSNTVLEKFLFIDASLDRAVSDAVEKNSNTVRRIESSVSEAGNRKEDVAVLKKAEEVRAKSGEIIKRLEELREQFVVATGGKDDKGGYKGAKNEDAIATIMINKGGGNELKKELNGFTQYLNSDILNDEDASSVSRIAYDGDKDPFWKQNPEQARKNFSELNFQATPMVAGLATLNQFKTEVLNREAIALNYLARQVGAADLKFDNIVAMARPESRVVAAGTKYKADLFIAASSSAVNPVMSYNGKEVPVEGGFGKVEFTASAKSFDEDNRSRQTYTAEIKVNQNGRDTVFTNEVEYFVTKPVIQVQSASVQALYLNCGNELQINVPALGSTYSPSFSASGARVVPGKKTGMVTVVPNSPKVDLKVSSNGNYIGTESFKVRRVPKPEIVILKPNGKPADEKKGESISRLRAIKISPKPDESFASFLPKDARYRVARAEVILARGSRPVKTMKVSETVNLSSMASLAKPGDRLIIDVKEVQRKNYLGNVEEVEMGTVIKTIPLN
mgnify:FL=1